MLGTADIEELSPMARPQKKARKLPENYKHPEADSPLRPDVGTQPQFPKQKRKPPKTYRYDSSLSPALDWDENPSREQAEALLAEILGADSLEEAKAAAAKLKAMSQPFLNWAGKAERLSFEVPTLPLFVHERLSTKAIINTLLGHKKGGDQLSLFDLFGDPQHSIVDQALKAYEHRNKWVNRMILGDSMQVMNSLLEYESLGGQVQMIYMDPPYGVKFGSNFQPFVRKKEVKPNDDDDMTREPEMVKAYRDTWELGLHSYLSYLRDRLFLSRDLLADSGSIFVQISSDNIHHVTELMDEVFGETSKISILTFPTKAGARSKLLPSTNDYLLWYAKNPDKVKFRKIFINKLNSDTIDRYDQVELSDGSRRRLTSEEKGNPGLLPPNSRRYQLISVKNTTPGGKFTVNFNGKKYYPKTGYWTTSEEGFQRLIDNNRIEATGEDSLRYVLYADDFPFQGVNSLWTDMSGGVQSRTDPKIYAVQTSTQVIQRCLLMTTDPGDLVLDPTCGSGTTATVAEQWGRRWITVDVSRVPLALARQRLLAATFPYYELKDEARGPAAGFVYKRKQNRKGEEVGGLVPHITLKSIANSKPPDEEVLVDRPEINNNYTRVTGPFTFEAVIPTPIDADTDADAEIAPANDASISFDDRMLEWLRKSPVLRLEGNRTLTFQQVRKPAKTLYLSAEALVKASDSYSPSLEDVVDKGLEQNSDRLPLSLKPVAFVFGPENGQIVERTVLESAKEAAAKNYSHLYVIGFAIHHNARRLIEECDGIVGIPATYVQATPDLMMGDLLKNMRSSQIFSVCGLPEIVVHDAEPLEDAPRYQVELLGLDVFDPTTMDPKPYRADEVPAWFLDTDYNGLCFHVCQAFFPRTAAWDGLKKALKGTYEDSVWDHLSGTISAPFEAGDHRQIAVKVIDDRGNELLVVKELKA